ncbi:MAG: hypothetical protein U1F25_17590 [Rubrivivax sp.]
MSRVMRWMWTTGAAKVFEPCGKQRVGRLDRDRPLHRADARALGVTQQMGDLEALLGAFRELAVDVGGDVQLHQAERNAVVQVQLDEGAHSARRAGRCARARGQGMVGGLRGA